MVDSTSDNASQSQQVTNTQAETTLQTGSFTKGGKRRSRSRSQSKSHSRSKKYGGKKTRGKKAKGKKGTKKRGVSSKLRAWINHVKAFSKKHGIKYNMALKNGKCKAEFHKHH